jgi:hypothetical protein
MRRAALIVLVLWAALVAPARADGLEPAWAGTQWGEPPEALQRYFGLRAFILPHPIDFGDSYTPLVLRDLPVGGFPMIVYYQIDKATHGLKRIQLERPRHMVNPVAFRGVYDALVAAYGAPDVACGIGPVPASGYQGTAEYVWSRGGIVIRAIFRDTTLEAFGGCFSPACGLTAQLLLRISPPAEDSATCPPLPTRGQIRSRS